MRKIAIASALVLSLGLAACGTTSPYGNYGNFVTTSTAGLDQQKIATDAVQQLVTLYPPAKTSFKLEQPTPDAFGQAFVADLRAQGYALLEYAEPAARPALDANASATPAPADTSSLPLRYVFDQARDMNLYRVTVWVGNQSITRPYVQQDGTAVPAGYWVRQE
jgi:hypothetical protein